MKISKSKLIQVIKEELTAVLTEESADEREDGNIDSLWRYARQNRRALNKLLKEAGHDELEGERPDTDEEAGMGSVGKAGWLDGPSASTLASRGNHYVDDQGQTHYTPRQISRAKSRDSARRHAKASGSGPEWT
jgi:hypothetical protein